MDIDFKTKQLSFVKNGNRNLGVAYENIQMGPKIIYKLAIAMSTENIEIELLDFTYVDDGFDRVDLGRLAIVWQYPRSDTCVIISLDLCAFTCFKGL